MDININKLHRSIKLLLQLSASKPKDDEFNFKMQLFLKKKHYIEEDVDKLFSRLSQQLMKPAYTVLIAICFEEHILLLLTMSMQSNRIEETQKYQLECMALSKLLSFSHDAKRFAKTYFFNKPAPFDEHESNDHMSVYSKKPKTTNCSSRKELDFDLDLEIIKCCYWLLKSDISFYRELWDWSRFMANYSYRNFHCQLSRLYCNHVMAMLTDMTTTQLHNLNTNIPADVLLIFDEQQKVNTHAIIDNLPDIPQEQLKLKFNITNHTIVNIEGVLLPIFNEDNQKFYSDTDGCYDRIVKVPSTIVNLRSIALGVAAAKPICLSGPVGCGKTTLIEYLARKTGRICPKSKEIESRNEESLKITWKPKGRTLSEKRKISEVSFEESMALENVDVQVQQNGLLRIQLGDQTDSKMLLGQYHCTDVPGEFLWLPGALTQAVMYGYWLLLEDLDAATQDTYTILSNLLERNYLSVPGFRDCVRIEPGFQLFVTVRTTRATNVSTQKSLYSLLEKYLYTINILPLSRVELCEIVRNNYSKLATIANRIVDVFLTFSRGDHAAVDNLRHKESTDTAKLIEKYVALPFEQVTLPTISSSGRLVSTRDLVKLCERANAQFSATSAECAYFVFQNAVDVFCSYLPNSKEKTGLITSIGSQLGIIRSRCDHYANEYKPTVQFGNNFFEIGRASLVTQSSNTEVNVDQNASKRQKITLQTKVIVTKPPLKRVTFSFTRLASCILERIAVCVIHSEPVLLVGETGVGKTSSVQYLADRIGHRLVVINMNNQSDISDLVGGFKPVELNYVVAPLRQEFEMLFVETFDSEKNKQFLQMFASHYNNERYTVIIRTMLNVINSLFKKEDRKLNPILIRWQTLRDKLRRLQLQLEKNINISFAFIAGSLVNSISNGDWVLLDEINLASAETLECLSTILEPDGSVVLLERGDLMPIERHPDFRIFACMNPNTDIGKKDLPVGIRNRFTEFYVDELTTEVDLSLLVGDYLANTGLQRKSVQSIVQLYKSLRRLAELQLNDGLGNRPVYSLRTLCRSLRICAKNLCGSIERNLYESFCMSFLTQLDPESHDLVLLLIQDALLQNTKAILNQSLPQLGENFLQLEGYWVKHGNLKLESCEHYILTASVKNNLHDLARIISIGRLPILLQGPTSAGKTSLIDYVARRSGNRCLRINNHEHTDLQEYIGTYAPDVTGKLSFREGVLAQAMRHGYWIILDELNLASSDILEALNRVLDDNRELYIAETQTVIEAHPNFMLFATQNPPGLYGGRKTLSRAFKNRFIELHFADIPRQELEIILEQRCMIPASYAQKMVQCMSQLQQHRKNTSKQIFTLRDLFRWGNRYTFADKELQQDSKYDWNQHLVEEGYLILSAKVRTKEERQLIERTLFVNFKKRIDLDLLFDIHTKCENSAVSRPILNAIRNFNQRDDIVWTRNMARMAVLTAKALQFDEPVLLVGPTGCGKTTVCQLLADIANVNLRILNCHMHTESADFLGGLRPCRSQDKAESSQKLFEWADGPLIYAMHEGSYFMADEISLAEDSVLERLNSILEPERSVLLAEKGGIVNDEASGISEASDSSNDFVVRAKAGFQFMATMNPGGDFGKKELSPALRNRFTEVWCLPSDSKEDLIEIAHNCMHRFKLDRNSQIDTYKIAQYMVEIVLFISESNEKFKFSVRDILAWANYMVNNVHLTFTEQAIFGLETVFLDGLEMLPCESQTQIEQMKSAIIDFAKRKAAEILNEHFDALDLVQKRGQQIELTENRFGIPPFFISVNRGREHYTNSNFLFDAPTTKQNLFRLLSAMSLQKPVLLEGPPGVGKTSIVESIADVIGYNIVRVNLCEHTDLADLFGTDLPAEDNLFERDVNQSRLGSFVWRDGPLLAALKAPYTWILLDELNLAPQSVLEGLNAVLDHRGEVFIPELNKSFHLSNSTRIFACQNPLKQGGGRKGLPQSFLNRFNKVYLRMLTTSDILHVVNVKYGHRFEQLTKYFSSLLDQERNAKCNIFDFFNGQSSTQSFDTIVFDLAPRLVRFSEFLVEGVTSMEFGYKGGPFEFNLRDVLRWCDLLTNPETGYVMEPAAINFPYAFQNFLQTLYERMQLVYYQRMRCEQDKLYIRNAFGRAFSCDVEQLNAISEDVSLYWSHSKIYLNDVVLYRGKTAGGSPQWHEQAPLLLHSQRQLLKQIVETVHMEKPLLLCGGTDSGKTKLIDTLCVLSDRICNTDTIDDSVTGSFQQIDLNRHLEAIYKNVKALIFAVVQECFQEQKEAILGCQLWSHLYKYNELVKLTTEFSQNSASNELQLFKNRLIILSNCITKLEQAPRKYSVGIINQLQQNKSQLTLLGAYLKSVDSLNTGGSFEWIDSRIVTSLKCGQYILLEHVNLCSPAVLDRLNPLFEPNGSLLIAEKGITAQNKAEVVHRSHNFRAFLTIDPKNGELSRAMRNRCVELSLPASKDAYSMDDMRVIVYNQGVKHTRDINCLLEIHCNISRLTEINAYTISHLTQFAFLTAAYIRIGHDMKQAIYVAAIEVYVCSSNIDLMGYGLPYYQNKLRQVVLTQTETLTQERGDHQQTDFLKDVMLKTDELHTLSLIKLQSVSLKILLLKSSDEHIPIKDLASVFSSMNLVNFSELNIEQLRRFLIYILYEACAFDDLEMRHLYLQHLLINHCELQKLSACLHNCLQEQGQRFQTLLPDLPWNRKLYPRLRDYAMIPETTEHGNALALSASLLAQLLLDNIPKQINVQLHEFDALQYSQALQNRSVSDKYGNDFLYHFYTFAESLNHKLHQLSEAKFGLLEYVNLLTNFSWFNRLLKAAQQKLLRNNELQMSLMYKLVLHFKWLEKHLLSALLDAYPCFLPTNSALGLSHERLKLYLQTTKRSMNASCKMYTKLFSQFQPFYLDQQIIVHRMAEQLERLLNVVPMYGNMDIKLWSYKWKALQSEEAFKWRTFLRASSKSFTLQPFNLCDSIRNTDLQKHLSRLHKIINQLKNIPNSLNDSLIEEINLTQLKIQLKKVESDDHLIDMDTFQLKSYKLLVFALYEYFLNRVLSGSLNADFDEQLNELYTEKVVTLNGCLWQCLNTLNSPVHTSILFAWHSLSNTLNDPENLEEFKLIWQQKNGNNCYKALRTYQRQFRNALQCYQLENLATRNDCVQIPAEMEISSRYNYQGPALTNILLALLCQSNGLFVSVPFSELHVWRVTLQQSRDLLWQNAQLVIKRHSPDFNNVRLVEQSAIHILSELEHIAQLLQEELQNDAGFNECVQELQSKLNQLKSGKMHSMGYNFDVALTNTLVGVLELKVLTHTPLIDPVEKNRLKNIYTSEDVDTIVHFKASYDFMKICMNYKHFGQEIYNELQRRLQAVLQKQEKLNQRLALRPEQCLYICLVQDIAHFIKSNCNCAVLYQLITTVKENYIDFKGPQVAKDVQIKKATELLNKIDVWLANAQRFVHHTLATYTAHYQDFVQPIKCAVNQMRFGLEQLKILFTRLLISGSVFEVERLEQTMSQIIEFPAQRPLSVSDSSVFNLLTKLPHSEHSYFRLLMAKLSELRNFITISLKFDETIFSAYDDALSICNQAWQEEENRRCANRAEEESLYKTKIIGGTEDDELVELQEIEQNFPTYLNKDFGEFVAQPTLEQVLKLNKKDDMKEKLTNIVNEQDYIFLVRNFIEVMSRYTSVVYKERPKCKYDDLQVISPFKARLEVFVQLHAFYKSALGASIDDSIYNALAFSVALQQLNLKDIDLQDGGTPETYDYYKDSNISALDNCLNVLDRIENRVLQQLELYPEHAGLADIKLVILRIRNLPANASLVRFNTGFQLLRQKLAIWNEVAHKKNNLMAEEIEVAEFVQSWTKLELQHWRNCLNQIAQKVEEHAYRYWFFIYNLVQVGADLPELIRTLRQFVEASCYGDFHVRLRMLHAFEMYLHNVERTGKRSNVAPLIAGLHNLQLYFIQFSNEVNETMKIRRAPIEKKLREFVKIQSYHKDLSYFSMRNNVANVHRNLNKFLKEYRLMLEQKITEVFQPKDVTATDYNSIKPKFRQMSSMLNAKNIEASEQLHEIYITEDLRKNKMTQKLAQYFGTARRIVQKTLANTEYHILIDDVDELVNVHLERCEQLRGLNVDRTKDRPQQKLQAKQILQQKRKALTDFFKVLSNLGFNYKTGLMELALRTNFENFQLPPFCVATMLADLPENWCSLNQHMDLYFMKSVFKLKLLQNIMLTPLSELGTPNIERISGFAVDSFIWVQKQRNQLSRSTTELHDLHNAVHKLHKIADIVIPQQVTLDQLNFSRNSDTFMELRHKLCQIQYVFQQWQLLVNCPPNQENCANSLLRTQIPLHRSEILDICDLILTNTKTQLQELEFATAEFLDSNKIQHYQCEYRKIIEYIKQVLHYLAVEHGEHLPMGQPLMKLLSTLECSTLKTTTNESIDLTNVETELPNITYAVLLALQKIYKKHENSKKEDKEKEKDLGELKEQHLKHHLTDQLIDDWKLLNIPRILIKISNVLLVLKYAPSSEEKLLCLRKAVALLPILKQYQLLADYIFLQQLGAHKTSVKMLCIMLTAFVEIGSKGFCVPPDLMQDEEGQSKQETKNSEGFGLEDGTGENDASDKIESEDQLDDAKRPEDRKEEADKENPDCTEENGIDMSEDFDAKMQNIEKPDNEEDDSGESDKDDDLNKEMGDTEEGAEKLDEQIWGDDEEEKPEEEQSDMNEEDQGKGTKDEKDSHNDLDAKNNAAKEDGKDEHEKDGLDATNEPNSENNHTQQPKDIDNMKEPELDEEQTNAMHNELEEPPEPENLDLGDLGNVDKDQEEDIEEPNDENPLDIDAMKEHMHAADEVEADDSADKSNEKEQESEDSESEAEETNENANNNDIEEKDKTVIEAEKENTDAETQTRGDEDKQEETIDEQDVLEGKPEQHTQSQDKPSKEENIQSLPDAQQSSSADNVQQQPDEDIKQDQKMDEQDTGEEKDGVGQAENDTNDNGHQGIAETKETRSQEDRKNEMQTQEKRKQGRTNDDRTLGEAEENKLKQLKTIDELNESKDEESEKQMDDSLEAEEYQHVKTPKNSDKTSLDNATEEQSKRIIHLDEDKDENLDVNNEDELMETKEPVEDQDEEKQPEQLTSEKMEQKSNKPSKSERLKESLGTPEQVEIEGEIIATVTVARNADTTAHSNLGILLDKSLLTQDLTTAEQIELRQLYHNQLIKSNVTPMQHEDFETWSSISNRMTQNARELCEQLRLILEPTKCTRLKGDYRTGRRINMKKIIPYIASQFRKDKIWLRRTKPAQRDYKITIAIDDSKSMHHNNSKTLTLEAISLVSQALTLLESGRLSIISFGETEQIIINHTEQFDGPRLVQALNFAQDKTKIAGLLDFIRTVNSEESGLGGDNGLFENLLLILSDGRNIFSEGNLKVKNAIKLARLQRIFLVYIIIDNPHNKNTIFEIQHVEVNADGSVKISPYLNVFPFPYYVIVRDLNQLPLVLSDAMRQWFELVNSE